MKKVVSLNSQWKIKSLSSSSAKEEEVLSKEGEWLEAQMPSELYTILRKNRRLADLLSTGRMEPYLDFCRQDWCFRKEFSLSIEDCARKSFLRLKGVDTFADVYLNGKKIGHCEDIFLPASFCVTGLLQEENSLCVRFYSPLTWLEQQTVPAEYGAMNPAHLGRIDASGFGCYYGARPCNRPMGLYRDVELELMEEAWLDSPDIRTEVSPDLKLGVLEISGGISGSAQEAEVSVKLWDPSGAPVLERRVPAEAGGSWKASFSLPEPQLWWPKGYGNQSLYQLEISLTKGGALQDMERREIGFRRITSDQKFHFRVNGKAVKLWGSNFAPLHAHDYTFDPEKCRAVLDWAELANMNSLRIWGGGIPYEDLLYQEADRRGLLLWQDFFHDWGTYPSSSRFRAQCRAEAEAMVLRLKHHPCILLWCGGNECYQGSEAEENSRFVGWEVFEIDYREVVSRLDPSRYYHPNCPYGGDYANDPTQGDSHVYSHIWFNRGFDYPLFQTENCRVCAPHLRSLKKMLGEENIWTEGYTGQVCKPGDTAFPPAWEERALLPDYLPRLPPLERFYDAKDPESLVYRFGAAHAWHMRDVIERARRGRPAADAFGERRTQGHFVWRLFDTWPEIFCSLLDYYMEPYQSIYAIKRAFAPVLVSFEITDHIYVWVVNDTPSQVKGTLRVLLFDPEENRTLREMELPVQIEAGKSAPVVDLDGFGEIRRKNFLYGELKDDSGRILARSNDFLDLERKLFFPDGKLSLIQQEGKLYVSADAFARCVELSAESEEGDQFGWIFEDNYFDLFPWEKKEITLAGNRKPAVITAKARFSETGARLKITG